jgi:DNA-binding response OmpR family regulator
MKSRMLLLKNNDEFDSVETIRSVASKLNLTLIEREVSSFKSSTEWEEYALILLDANSTVDLAEVICLILRSYADASIVVLSATPTWYEAREVLMAGAIDYEDKSLPEASLFALLRRVLARLLLQTA